MYAVNRSALVEKIALAPCGLKRLKCTPETMNTSSRPILSPTTQVSARPTHTAGPRLSAASRPMHTIPAAVALTVLRK